MHRSSKESIVLKSEHRLLHNSLQESLQLDFRQRNEQTGLNKGDTHANRSSGDMKSYSY